MLLVDLEMVMIAMNNNDNIIEKANLKYKEKRNNKTEQNAYTQMSINQPIKIVLILVFITTIIQSCKSDKAINTNPIDNIRISINDREMELPGDDYSLKTSYPSGGDYKLFETEVGQALNFSFNDKSHIVKNVEWDMNGDGKFELYDQSLKDYIYDQAGQYTVDLRLDKKRTLRTFIHVEDKKEPINQANQDTKVAKNDNTRSATSKTQKDKAIITNNRPSKVVKQPKSYTNTYTKTYTKKPTTYTKSTTSKNKTTTTGTTYTKPQKPSYSPPIKKVVPKNSFEEDDDDDDFVDLDIVTPTPDPETIEEVSKTTSSYKSRSARAGYQASNRCKDGATISGSFACTLSPAVNIKLEYVYVYANDFGSVNVTLKNQTSGEMESIEDITVLPSENGTELNLEDLDMYLTIGNTYVLTVLPTDNNIKFEDASGCNNGSNTNGNLNTKYKGKAGIFNIKYRY